MWRAKHDFKGEKRERKGCRDSLEVRRAHASHREKEKAYMNPVMWRNQLFNHRV